MRYALIFLLLAGCASERSHDYAQSETGAVIGGLLGNQVGHGGSRAAATVIGAVGGGIAGNAIERKLDEQDGQEVVIQLDNGATVAIVQPGPQNFEAGDRVRVLTGPKGSRVERG